MKVTQTLLCLGLVACALASAPRVSGQTETNEVLGTSPAQTSVQPGTDELINEVITDATSTSSPDAGGAVESSTGDAAPVGESSSEEVTPASSTAAPAETSSPATETSSPEIATLPPADFSSTSSAEPSTAEAPVSSTSSSEAASSTAAETSSEVASSTAAETSSEIPSSTAAETSSEIPSSTSAEVASSTAAPETSSTSVESPVVVPSSTAELIATSAPDAASTGLATGGNNGENPTGPQTSPQTATCASIQFEQKPTETDVTFSAITDREYAWVDFHTNVLEAGQTPYPADAPVELNSWSWNYRMDQVNAKEFNFKYTTGPNGFNFQPNTQRLQYFFTFCSELTDCNTQSFVYNPRPGQGGQVTPAPEQPTDGQTPVFNTPGDGVCPALNFTFSVAPKAESYEVQFNPVGTRDVIWVDAHFNVLEAGETPYPANAPVEANHWFWNYRMVEASENKFAFQLTTGQNGMNYKASQTLQFFFTYCVEKTDCNTQSFVYNPATGALVSPTAPQGNGFTPIAKPNRPPRSADGLTFCEKYTKALFGASNSTCYQTSLISAFVKRTAYGDVTAKVQGVFANASDVVTALKQVQYGGKTYSLAELLNDETAIALISQNLIELLGRIFGCNSASFPDFKSNPTYAATDYTYIDITAIRNSLKGLNLPSSVFETVQTQMIDTLRSFGVSQQDINQIARPALQGLFAGLVGQQSVTALQRGAISAARSTIQLGAAAAVAVPAVIAALLF